MFPSQDVILYMHSTWASVDVGPRDCHFILKYLVAGHTLGLDVGWSEICACTAQPAEK